MMFEINKRMFETDIGGGSTPLPSEDAENKESKTLEPKTRLEYFLNKIAESGGSAPTPIQITEIEDPDNPDYTFLSISTEELEAAWNNQIPVYLSGDWRLVSFQHLWDGRVIAIFVDTVAAWRSNFPAPRLAFMTSTEDPSKLISNTPSGTEVEFNRAFGDNFFVRADYGEWKDENYINQRGLYITCTKYWDVVSNLGVSEDKGERRSYFGKFIVGTDTETGAKKGEFEWVYFPFYADSVDPIIEALIKDKLLNTMVGEDTLADYMIKEQESFSFVL